MLYRVLVACLETGFVFEIDFSLEMIVGAGKQNFQVIAVLEVFEWDC